MTESEKAAQAQEILRDLYLELSPVLIDLLSFADGRFDGLRIRGFIPNHINSPKEGYVYTWDISTLDRRTPESKSLVKRVEEVTQIYHPKLVKAWEAIFALYPVIDQLIIAPRGGGLYYPGIHVQHQDHNFLMHYFYS